MNAECGKDSAGDAARKGFRAERARVRPGKDSGPSGRECGPERIPGRAGESAARKGFRAERIHLEAHAHAKPWAWYPAKPWAWYPAKPWAWHPAKPWAWHPAHCDQETWAQAAQVFGRKVLTTSRKPAPYGPSSDTYSSMPYASC